MTTQQYNVPNMEVINFLTLFPALKSLERMIVFTSQQYQELTKEGKRLIIVNIYRQSKLRHGCTVIHKTLIFMLFIVLTFLWRSNHISHTKNYIKEGTEITTGIVYFLEDWEIYIKVI